MYFEYFVMAFIGYGVLDAFLGFNGDSDENEDTQTEPETNTGDETDPLDGDSDADYIPDATTATVTTDGETSTTTFEDVDFGVAPTILGTDTSDDIAVSDNTGLEININAGDGDDTIAFGYGASVDSGEGADDMTLSVTSNALASDSDAGTIDLTDRDDALVINFEDGTPEFVHSIRGQSSEQVEGVTVQVDWIDYYVSGSADLSNAVLDENDAYEATDATHVFRVVIGEGTQDAPAEVNTDPSIQFNRTVSSARNLVGG